MGFLSGIGSLARASGLFDLVRDGNKKRRLRVLIVFLVALAVGDRGAFDAIVFSGVLGMRSHEFAKRDPAPVNVALRRHHVEQNRERLSSTAHRSDQQREKVTKRARLKTEVYETGAQRLVVRLGCRHDDVEDIPATQAPNGTAS